MTLGRKGLTSGANKGLTVCCLTRGCVFVFYCKHTAFHCFSVCTVSYVVCKHRLCAVI
ncbi:unnamed protein product [Staurois parvus]|uniref:Uncharacterized protein n=1 Tax=Staurois parvus TaxID=386267 RepID=A0ABN9AZ19_9NEOB|nr:unnamed protein product [Staurois parvus]